MSVVIAGHRILSWVRLDVDGFPPWQSAQHPVTVLISIRGRMSPGQYPLGFSVSCDQCMWYLQQWSSTVRPYHAVLLGNQEQSVLFGGFPEHLQPQI